MAEALLLAELEQVETQVRPELMEQQEARVGAWPFLQLQLSLWPLWPLVLLLVQKRPLHKFLNLESDAWQHLLIGDLQENSRNSQVLWQRWSLVL